MRNTILFIAILFVTTAFQTGKPAPKDKLRIKQAIHYLSKETDTTTYTYNPDGHIAHIKNTNGNDIKYEYLPGMIIKKYYESLRKIWFSANSYFGVLN